MGAATVKELTTTTTTKSLPTAATCMLNQRRIQRGGGRGPTPSEKSQIIGFLSDTGLDPLKNHKATKPAFNLGLSSAVDCPLRVVFGSFLPPQTKKERKEKNVVEVGSPLTKLSGSAHV